MKRILPAAGLAFVLAACSPTPVTRVEEPPPTPAVTPTPAPIATPHPATGAQQRAVQLYPDLAKEGSIFNQTFRELYEQEKTARPQLLAQIDWPLTLAYRTAQILGVQQYQSTPSPRIEAPPTPKPFGTVLEQGAYGERKGVAKTPMLRYIP